MGGAPALQNGGNGDTQRVVEGERRDGEGGSQRCILHSPNTPRPPTSPAFPGGPCSLPVYMSTLRPILCTMSIYQSDEATHNIPSEYGGSHDHLYRRHSIDGGVSRPSKTPPEHPGAPTGWPGIHYQSGQINNLSCSADRVSGSPGRLNHITPKSARREASPHKAGGGAVIAESASNSTTSSPDNRETARNISGSSPSPSVLPIPTGGPTEGTEQQQSGLQCSTFPLPSSPGRINVVAGEAFPMEWQGSGSPTGSYSDSVRCIPTWLGSCVQWHQNWGALDSGGTGNAHKLPGVVGSNPSSTVLPEKSSRSIHMAATRQSNSRSVHQQSRGDSLSPVDKAGKGPVDVGTIQGYRPGCRTHSRDNQLCGRCRVQISDGPNRLETPHPAVQPDQRGMGPTGSGPVCLSSVQSTSEVLQLETRPTGRSYRCLQPEVESPEGLCKSSVVPSGQSPQPREESTSSSYSCSSSLEGAAMVPSLAGDVVRLPQTTPSHPQPDSMEARPQSVGSTAPVGHVAYLREKFGRANLSSKAKELILSSWRSKTSRSYDSHFKKWLGWCTERGCDPISGPASDVANFLADLHSQGYQTSSLNAYRSAISSVHDKVDDVEVGKHPLVARLLKGAFQTRPPFLVIQVLGMSRWYLILYSNGVVRICYL